MPVGTVGIMKKTTSPPTTAAKAAKIPKKVSNQQKGDLSTLFSNARYLTCGIEAEIAPITQLLLWELIDQRRLEGAELDYLQVFQLEPDGQHQKITHSQEEPPFEQESLFIGPKPVTAKIYVIDDGNHTTMLFPEER